MDKKNPHCFRQYCSILILVVFSFVPLVSKAESECCCEFIDTNNDTYVDRASGRCESVNVDVSAESVCQAAKGEDWASQDQLFCLPSTTVEEPVRFVPQVSLPSLRGEAQFKENEPILVAPIIYGEGNATKFVVSDLLTKYLITWYELLIFLAGFLALVMIVWGGFKWMWGAGNEELIGSAKHTIVNAVMGLLLALSAYLILAIINPRLVVEKKQGLILRYVDRRELAEEEHDGTSSPLMGDEVILSGDNIVTLRSIRVIAEVQNAVQNAASSISGSGVQIFVADGIRTQAQQQAQINSNCPSGASRSGECTPPTCLMGPNHDDPSRCPHPSGRAIDAWGFRDGAQCILRAKCIDKNIPDNLNECRKNPCQLVIGRALEDAEFCNIPSEPWHFEYIGDGHAPVSPACRKIYTDL